MKDKKLIKVQIWLFKLQIKQVRNRILRCENSRKFLVIFLLYISFSDLYINSLLIIRIELIMISILSSYSVLVTKYFDFHNYLFHFHHNPTRCKCYLSYAFYTRKQRHRGEVTHQLRGVKIWIQVAQIQSVYFLNI